MPPGRGRTKVDAIVDEDGRPVVIERSRHRQSPQLARPRGCSPICPGLSCFRSVPAPPLHPLSGVFRQEPWRGADFSLLPPSLRLLCPPPHTHTLRAFPRPRADRSVVGVSSVGVFPVSTLVYALKGTGRATPESLKAAGEDARRARRLVVFVDG